MSFSSSPLDFGLDLADTVRSIRLHLLAKGPPPVLYHYTSFEGVIGIGDSCALRAFSAENMKDRTEIQHGIDVVREEIRRNDPATCCFARMLLRSIPEALMSRKRWTFVTCFCPELGSSHHRDNYGKYCLRFETLSSPDPQLRPLGLHAEAQYQHVIYTPSEQHDAIRQAVDSIADSAERNSSGNPQGPWAPFFVKDHARVAAQCLMNIIASLKAPEYCHDNEWRIVCSPRYSMASSAPDLDDDGFRRLIQPDCNKRYVELSVREQSEAVFVSFPRSVIPFSGIYVPDDFQRRDNERLAILQMLKAKGRYDISLLPFPKG